MGILKSNNFTQAASSKLEQVIDKNKSHTKQSIYKVPNNDKDKDKDKENFISDLKNKMKDSETKYSLSTNFELFFMNSPYVYRRNRNLSLLNIEEASTWIERLKNNNQLPGDDITRSNNAHAINNIKGPV